MCKCNEAHVTINQSCDTYGNDNSYKVLWVILKYLVMGAGAIVGFVLAMVVGLFVLIGRGIYLLMALAWQEREAILCGFEDVIKVVTLPVWFPFWLLFQLAGWAGEGISDWRDRRDAIRPVQYAVAKVEAPEKLVVSNWPVKEKVDYE